MSSLEKLKEKSERLELELKNAQTTSQIDTLRVPWWRKGKWVSGLTGLLVAVVPLTTAVHGCIEKDKELEMQEFKTREEIRTSYLDREKQPGQHLRTLRFIMATSNDGRLLAWATAEQRYVEDDLKVFDAVTEARRQELWQLEAALADGGVAVAPRVSSQQAPVRVPDASTPPAAALADAGSGSGVVEHMFSLKEELRQREERRLQYMSLGDGGGRDDFGVLKDYLSKVDAGEATRHGAPW